MSTNVFIPAGIKDKSIRDTFLAIVKELGTVAYKPTISSGDPTSSTLGTEGQLIYAESTNSIWLFKENGWVKILGATGADGADGTDGTDGATGSTGSTGSTGTAGTNGDRSITIYLYDSSVNEPTNPSTNAGFTTGGAAANTGSWTATVPSIGSGEALWLAQNVLTQSNSTGNYSSGGWTVYRAQGYDGATGSTGSTGPTGSPAPRFESRRVYLAYTPGTNNPLPATPTGTLTWSTGALVPNPTTWNEVPPTKVINSAVNIYFSDFLFIDTSGTSTTSSDTGTTSKKGTSFSGVVSFVDGDFALDGSTVTNIDGGNITTDSIKTDQIDIDNHLLLAGNNSGILGGRSSISSYREAGVYIGRELRPYIMGPSGMHYGREYQIVTVGTSNWTTFGAASNTVGERFIYNGAPTSGNGTIQLIGFEVSHSSVNGSLELEGIIHNETEGLRIFNPELISGGNVVTGVDTKTSSGVTLLGVGSALGVITLSALGGGGGGGYGLENYTGSGSGGTGGTTTVKLRTGSASGTVVATLTATGAAGGLNAPTLAQQGGLAGASSEFGLGGAYVTQGFAANPAPSTSYGAGGGGAGGDSQGFFGQDGAGGSGGSAAIKQTITYNAINNGNNIYLDIVSIGAGGAGGTGGNRNGGAGAAGVVQHTAVMGSTVSKEVRNLATNQYNTIGSYCLAMVDPASSIQLTVGTQIAGSNLKPAAFGSAGNGSNSALYISRQNTSLSGTWKSIGGSATTNSFFITLWVRIS
jgi:collagen type VII alpha